MKICILGAGSFGRALEGLLRRKYCSGPQADRCDHRIFVWKRGMDFDECLAGADFAVFAVPAQAFRQVFSDCLPYLGKDTIVVNAAKGIELETLKRLSQTAEELRPGTKYAALSGPSHAEEIEQELPTAVTVCSEDEDTAKRVQDLFMTESFRVYTGSDMAGTEIGGAVKNVIALAAGISDGLGFGDNTKAALMTRGMAEITRLGSSLGAKPETFLGLTGFGDLIVTCTSMHSRNRRCGILLGKGMPADEAVREIGMVVEGAATARAAASLAEKLGVEMPITAAVCAILDGRTTPADAVGALMTRTRKPE